MLLFKSVRARLSKRTISYARHAVPYGNGRQARAIIECILPYARYRVGYNHRGKSRAIVEGRPSYARY